MFCYTVWFVRQGVTKPVIHTPEWQTPPGTGMPAASVDFPFFQYGGAGCHRQFDRRWGRGEGTTSPAPCRPPSRRFRVFDAGATGC